MRRDDGHVRPADNPAPRSLEMPPRKLSRLLAAIALGLVAADAPAPTHESKSVRLYTASDAPALAEGVGTPADGEYALKVWGPTAADWAFRADGLTLTLTLTGRPAGDATPVGWKTVGTARLKKGESVRVVFGGGAPASDAPEKKAAPAPANVPAALVLTNDPEADPAPLFDMVRGRLDTASPSADARRSSVRTNQQGAGFQPPATAEAWNDRARAVREQLLVTNGLWPAPPKTPLHPKVVGTLDRGDYVIEKVVLETLPGFTLSGNVYRPSKSEGKMPGVLSPHGHYADGRVNVDVQQRCIRLAKLGCVVFMYDMVGYNDSKAFGHTFLNDRLRRWGLSLVTLQTWNSVRALDYLTDRDDVDPARIACTGESGGGTQTFLLTAIDDRIKVAAPVVMVSEGFQGGCVCENCAGMRLGTDNVEIAALTAPRPLKLVGATGDWTKHTVSKVYPAIRSVYELLGKTDRVSADLFDYQHNYNQTSRNAVYPFLAYWLLGVGDPSATLEGEQAVEEPGALWTFTAEAPAPANLRTPEAIENDLIRSLGWSIEELGPSVSPAAWEASRRYLSTSHRVRTGVVNPPAETIETVEVRRTAHGGIAVVHSEVGRAGVGDRVPVVRLIPKDATGRVTVIASPRGKADLADADAPASLLARELIKRGQGVVFFDPLFVGESADPAGPVSARPATVHADCYNPSTAADQLQDLATVVAWTRFQPDVREVSLVGFGEAGAQALIARPVLGGLARTAVDLAGVRLGDGSTPLPVGLDLPGLFQFGGLKAAAALTSPAPLWVTSAGGVFDTAWPTRSYALDDAAGRLKVGDAPAPAEALARWIDAGE